MSHQVVYYLVSLFVFHIGNIQGERILMVLPVPLRSHQDFYVPFITELKVRGHDIILITAMPSAFTDTIKNITIIDVSEGAKTFSDRYFLKLSKDWMSEDKPTKYKATYKNSLRLFEEEFKSEKIASFLNEDNNIDLVIVEAYIGPTIVFSHLLSAPIVLISPVSFQYRIHHVGLSSHPFYYPDNLSNKAYNLTVFDKCKEIKDVIKIWMILQTIMKNEEDVIHDLYGENIPSMDELSQNAEMLFVSTHHVWDGNRPVSKEIILIEGLNTKPKDQINNDLNDYLNDSKNGVIYVCFGTTSKIELLPKGKINLLINVLANSSYNVVWSGDIDNQKDPPKNFRVFNWVPQDSLLKHPNIKLFITHGGVHSISEAVDAGVPIVSMPIITDQFANAERVVFHEVGFRLNWVTLTENELKITIYEVINDKRYQKKSQQLGMIKRDQPHSPLRRAVFWTEHVMRHKGFQHHRSPATCVSWAEYLVLDLVSCLVCFFGILIVTAYFILKMFLKTAMVRMK